MSNAEEIISASISWNTRLEEYFQQTGEKAHCYSWLHKKAEEKYSSKMVYIDLPCIILGVLNGAVSVGSQSLFGDSPYASVGIGLVALFTSILNTIGSYFAWGRRAESHKIASTQYSKLYRFLGIELSLPRHERMTPSDLLKYTKEQYDRLAESSPLVPAPIIDDFRKRFGKLEGITFPEETNGLHPIHVYTNHGPLSISPTFQPFSSGLERQDANKSKEVVQTNVVVSGEPIVAKPVVSVLPTITPDDA